MAHTFEDLIVTMFDCASSLPDEESQEEGRRCLVAVGKAHPAVFFSSLHAYLLQNTRLSGAIRAFALLTAKEVLEDSATLASVDEQQALLIINLTTQEMTMSKDADEEWPRSACDLLVTMSKSKFLVSHVVDAVLQKFPPGLAVPPHRYVAHTLGGIAEHNATGFIPFLTDILSRTVPLLQHIRTDSQRLAWSYALRAFCESIREFRTLNGKEQTVIGRNLRSQEETEKNKNSFISNADLSDKSDNDSSDTDYSDQLSLAFDHVFNMMTSKDHRVRAEAAYCIGELCLLIPSEKLIEDIRKIVPAFIAVYKKAGNDQLIVTFGICRFLEASCRDESCPLDSYLEEILNILFPNVCLSSAESLCSPVSIKNQNETFRCFHVAATRFADKIVYYLLHKMQNVQDSVKLGAINVLRHLLNSAGPYIEDKRSLVIMGLKPMLVVGNDGSLSIRAKQGMCQLCVALADHGYVDVEGGENVIAFLLRNLIASDDVPKQTSFETKKISNVVDAESATSSHLRTQCGQALQTISKTCEYAHKLLWPLLFEYICVESYMSVLGDIFKCIRLLVERMEKDGKEADFETGFDSPRVARSHQVFSRLFTCLYGAPLNNALWSRTRESLLLIRALSSWFHPSIHKVTMERFEQLECILNDLCPPGSSNKSNVIKEGHVMVEPRSARVARWHAHVLDFLNFCVVGVNDGEWRCSLAAAMAKQITLCNNQPDEKALLMRCLGGVLARITNTSFVVDHIILMYRGAFHAHHVERVGCAQAVGYCASSHTDLVLTELENIAKWENIHKSSGLLGFLKNAVPYRDYSDAEMVNLRATIMLSYGYVIFYCPVDGVTQRLEQTVLLFLRRYLENPKQEVVVREALLESIFLFAVSVHPTHLNSDYIFEARNELLLYIKQCIEIESPEMLSSSVRLLGAKATAALVRLEPPLNEKDVWDLGLVLTKFTFALCREKSGLKTIDDDESSTMMEATVLQYHNALEQLVRKQATVTMVTHILKLLQPYYASLADHERSRAVEATLVVLNVYFEHATDLALGRANEFGPMSSLLARLIPRMCDSLCSIRHTALRVVHRTFCLSFVHKGVSREIDDSTLFSPEEFISENLSDEGKINASTSRRVIKKMAEVVDARLPQSQMQTYLSGLLDMLNDRQSLVSSAAAQLLYYSLTCRGETLHKEAETLVSNVLQKLRDVHSSQQTYADLISALVAFAVHQSYSVVDVLLMQTIPYSPTNVDAWRALARDHDLFPQLMDYVLEMLNNQCDPSDNTDTPYEMINIGNGLSTKVVQQELCVTVSALIELIKGGEPENELTVRVPSILCSVLQYLTTVTDTQYPLVIKEAKNGNKIPLLITSEQRRAFTTPAALAAEAIRHLLSRANADDIIEQMNGERAWSDCVDSERFTTAICVLSRSIDEHRCEWVAEIVNLLASRIESPCISFRLTAVAVLSSLILRCSKYVDEEDGSLLGILMRSLERSLEDKSMRIRKLSIHGFGDLSCCAPWAIEKYSQLAINAAMRGLDDSGDRRDELAMEAIDALNKLSAKVDKRHLDSILASVLLKLPLCFEKESGALRAVSFSLFGELGMRVGDCDVFRKQLHTNLVAILLHLNDEDEATQAMCGRSLLMTCSLMNSELVRSLIHRQFNLGGGCSDYLKFLSEVSMALATAHPDRLNSYVLDCCKYFKSTSSKIRENAAYMTGYLLGSLTSELRSTITKEPIYAGLLSLLKDHDVNVRLSAAHAVSCLNDFS